MRKAGPISTPRRTPRPYADHDVRSIAGLVREPLRLAVDEPFVTVGIAEPVAPIRAHMTGPGVCVKQPDCRPQLLLAGTVVVGGDDDVRAPRRVTDSTSRTPQGAVLPPGVAAHADRNPRRPHRQDDRVKRDGTRHKPRLAAELSRETVSQMARLVRRLAGRTVSCSEQRHAADAGPGPQGEHRRDPWRRGSYVTTCEPERPADQRSSPVSERGRSPSLEVHLDDQARQLAGDRLSSGLRVRLTDSAVDLPALARDRVFRRPLDRQPPGPPRGTSCGLPRTDTGLRVRASPLVCCSQPSGG
jgi:hypothetical protein